MPAKVIPVSTRLYAVRTVPDNVTYVSNRLYTVRKVPDQIIHVSIRACTVRTVHDKVIPASTNSYSPEWLSRLAIRLRLVQFDILSGCQYLV